MPDGNSGGSDELLERVKSIQDDVNDMQGDLRVLSTLNKGLNREALVNLIHDSFGRSKNKKLTWYFADGSRTVPEIARAAEIPERSARWAGNELNKAGWLVEAEQDDPVIYRKADVCTGLGIESTLEEELDL